MFKILIPTMPNDEHAICVHLALQSLGCESYLLQTADFPTQQRHSYEIQATDIHWHVNGQDIELNNQVYDAVWFRRPRAPVISDKIHKDDFKNAFNENNAFYNAMWHVIGPNSFWVNSYESAKRSTSKLLQLKVAKETGLQIPPSLLSNDPNRIKNFILQMRDQETIYKTLYPHVWFEKDNMRLAYTRVVTLDDLPSDFILQNVPGIFQKKIHKAYELRIVYFGTYYIAVKLKSQEHKMGEMDWRCIPTRELAIEPYQLPDKIDSLCRKFMAKLGLVFGCFDFIVTPQKEYYFLEINEQGQFLWIEELNPEIRLLDTFCKFLIGRNKTFHPNINENKIQLHDLNARAGNFKEAALKKHVLPSF